MNLKVLGRLCWREQRERKGAKERQTSGAGQDTGRLLNTGSSGPTGQENQVNGGWYIRGSDITMYRSIADETDRK